MSKYFNEKVHDYQVWVASIVNKGAEFIKNGDQFSLLDKLMYLMIENVESDVNCENLSRLFNFELLKIAIKPLFNVTYWNGIEFLDKSSLKISSCKNAFTMILEKIEKKN